MYKYLAFLILITLPVMLNAQKQNTSISITFLHQKNEPFSLARYENTLIEEEGLVLMDTFADENGYLSFSIELKKPEILVLRSMHDDFKIYCNPGDSIQMVIVNSKNAQFYGEGSVENNLLYKGGFQSDMLQIGGMESFSDAEKFKHILSSYAENMEALKQNTELSDDFKRYFYAENFGKKYFSLYVLKNKIKSDNNAEILNLLEPELLKFHYEQIIDEPRSRLYLNCFVVLQDILITTYSFQINYLEDLWREYPYENMKRRVIFVNDHPNLLKIFRFSAVNALIYRAEDTISLFHAVPYLNYLNTTYTDSYLNETLKKRFEEKKKKITLSNAYNFTAEYIDGTIFKLSDYKDRSVLLYFWATWCKPCLESMPKLNDLAQKFDSTQNLVILAINIRDSKAKWNDHLHTNIYGNLRHVHLSHDESSIVFDKFHFETVPNYIFLGKELEVLIPGKNDLNASDEALIDIYSKQ